MPLIHWQVWVGIGAGGALGAMARYAVTLALHGSAGRWPLATLSVNLLGCFAAGLASAWLLRSGAVTSAASLAFTTGFLGAFTTFSAFSVETLGMFENGRMVAALMHALSNLVGALLAVAAGAALARLI